MCKQWGMMRPPKPAAMLPCFVPKIKPRSCRIPAWIRVAAETPAGRLAVAGMIRLVQVAAPAGLITLTGVAQGDPYVRARRQPEPLRHVAAVDGQRDAPG